MQTESSCEQLYCVIVEYQISFHKFIKTVSFNIKSSDQQPRWQLGISSLQKGFKKISSQIHLHHSRKPHSTFSRPSNLPSNHPTPSQSNGKSLSSPAPHPPLPRPRSSFPPRSHFPTKPPRLLQACPHLL